MTKPMKTIVLILATMLTAVGVRAEDILIRDGAACTIPEGSNSAPFDALYNPNGMSEFCVFPFIPLKEAIAARLEGEPVTSPITLPECGDGLSVSPGRGGDEFPCFIVVTE